METMSSGTLTGEARIWIYQADRFLNEQEDACVYRKIEGLLAGWNTHGKHLTAEAWIEDHLFLILAVDESQQYASGCSIDQSTNVIRMIGNRINVDFFERMNFAYLDSAGIPRLISHKEMPKLYEKNVIGDDTLFYDTTLNKKEDWVNQKLKPLGESWHKRFV